MPPPPPPPQENLDQGTIDRRNDILEQRRRDRQAAKTSKQYVEDLT